MTAREVFVVENGAGQPQRSALDRRRVHVKSRSGFRVVRYVPEHFEVLYEAAMARNVELQRDPKSLAAKVTELETEIAKLKAIVEAGNRLAQSVICCALHTWQNIPVQSKFLAVTMGCRMYEYIEISPYFEWPEADPGRFAPLTREQLKERLADARKRQI